MFRLERGVNECGVNRLGHIMPHKAVVEALAIARRWQCGGTAIPGRNQVAFAACVLLKHYGSPARLASAAVSVVRVGLVPTLVGLQDKRKNRGQCGSSRPRGSRLHYRCGIHCGPIDDSGVGCSGCPLGCQPLPWVRTFVADQPRPGRTLPNENPNYPGQ